MLVFEDLFTLLLKGSWENLREQNFWCSLPCRIHAPVLHLYCVTESKPRQEGAAVPAAGLGLPGVPLSTEPCWLRACIVPDSHNHGAQGPVLLLLLLLKSQAVLSEWREDCSDLTGNQSICFSVNGSSSDGYFKIYYHVHLNAFLSFN